ncbi:MAG: hypothetical protein K1X75_13610 [Leptospirales bacterium]|nr:hypothetical protein [Leptospirales bacterium]
MIRFSWSLLGDDRFQVQVRTPLTRVGVLHRMCAAIYVFGLDIVSGNVMTTHDEGGVCAQDNFVLRLANAPENEYSIYETTGKLGGLMEALLDDTRDPSEILRQYGTPEPRTDHLFDERSRLEFTDVPLKHMTRLAIHVADRTGLLYHVTRSLAAEGVSVWSAVILTTDTGWAEDAFYIQYQEGVVPAELAQRIAARITTASAPDRAITQSAQLD